ncbi:MAG: FG-GAP repeat protein, partial [Candidatus Cloacimonetes bacterium]|nr:FG-GAP repeat protein [Candidatus Cloacimonadota bacterium]MCF7814696.1 FG-GAP repeat protein [Candidatus Cloacimonadota bacterium]MCF7884578.1 FG-GAP repeat protein [Candidatus Cloacimonadota bacterium]
MKIRLMIILLFIFTTNIVCGLSRHKIENDHPGGTLGYRVKLDGDILASSKYVTDDTSGGVMIYNRNLGGENNWGEEDYLYSPVAAGTGDYFGYATDLYDDILIVGRPGGSNDEKAFIFQRGGDGTWNLVRTLDPSEAPEMDETTDNNLAFGWSVAINDEWAVVGAPNDNSENGTQPLVGDQAGAIYTWRKVAGVWTFYDKWTAYIDDEAEQNDALGRSVDLWGDNIVVGALYADIKDPDFPHDVKDDAGAAYLLHPANGVWYLTKKLQAPFEEAHDGDHFGWDVAIWGSRIIVGAPKHWGGGTAMMHFGAAFTYFRSFGTNHEHTFYDPDPQQSSLFGASVDVYMNSIIISNQLQRRYYPDATPPGDYSVGVTYHYGLCSDAQFHLLHTLWPENYVTDYDDSYACDVTMDGPYYLCVGSFTDDDLANGAGASYVYWLGDYYGEPGDGAEAEGDDGSGGNNGGATTSGSAFPSPYADCVIINEYEATPTGPIDDTQEWIELLVIAEDGVDMRNWLLTDVNPEDFYLDNTNPGYNDASIKFNDYAEFSSIPCGTTIVIYDGNGPTNDVDSSDGDMFIYTESEYLNRVAFSYSTIQLD